MKSHFQFTNQQRNGIFLLCAIIVILQCLYWFVPNVFSFTNNTIPENTNKINAFKKELDSLRLIEIENSKPKIYPFNPNYITDYKGYSLGMTNAEIDRLHKFRATNKWVNSAKEFQQVTKVSDSFLKTITPYFKFPDWVTNPKPKSQGNYNSYTSKPKTFNQKIDLNTATAIQLQKVYGVGEKLSERIINYRNKYKGGFIADIQLSEVWGLSTEVIERIHNDFTVKTPRAIKIVHLNTATRDELVTVQYIDYEVANNIIEERTLRDGFSSLDELMKVEDFPIKKIEIIKLYLQL
ncbi:helix-hairpin-helix domain-containing protein [Winogradskyella undariae]|uniref:ComEA family DNA-binding protein n=1 Tax=Winogradskyella TaxID=286104 RepID=UPI00156B0C40|nr:MULTISPECIES: helix-hairpin-helix domain-containing protein [Winogradskyella]NRR90435.1 helix-hairpin-helix domain-containing protein [Winogradskyella undariae]QXP79714.1 helix-hairpin-helix domain-containing protein [Winogradskyella sp. HaHa_3_26]